MVITLNIIKPKSCTILMKVKTLRHSAGKMMIAFVLVTLLFRFMWWNGLGKEDSGNLTIQATTLYQGNVFYAFPFALSNQQKKQSFFISNFPGSMRQVV